MLKKRNALFLLCIFAFISWGIWLLEVNPFLTNTWDWIRFKKITFILTPLLFIVWGYMSQVITKIFSMIFNLLIFFIFFLIILFLIMAAHIAGPAGIVFLISPFYFLLYKPIVLILISFFTFVFNLIITELNHLKIIKKEFLIIIYTSFFIIPIVMFFISCLFKIFNANEYITGFFGYNNMDTILWFKTGIVIPLSFIYEGYLLLFLRNENTIINIPKLVDKKEVAKSKFEECVFADEFPMH